MLMRALFAMVVVLAVGSGELRAEADWVGAWGESMAQASSSTDPEEARALYGQALELAARHGNGTLRHARTLDELAWFHLSRGELERSEALYLESIPLFRKLLGPGQPRLATSLHNLGALYLRAGQEDRAGEPIREALRIWTAAFGTEHPDTARAFRSLSVLMRRQGRHEEADRLEKSAAPYLTPLPEPPAR